MHKMSQEVRGHAQHGTRGKGQAQHGTRGKGQAQHGTRGNGHAQHGTRGKGHAQHGTRGKGHAQHGTRGKGHAQHGTRGKGHADTKQHKQHIYHSTNKHSLSQDGSSDTSPKRWGISAPYSAHTSNTSITAQTNTAYRKMGHLIGAAKRWDISAAYCATHLSQHKQTHLSQHKQTQPITRWVI